MELSKNCPVQRLVHEYQAMIPIGVPANGLVSANQQQGMRMEFRGIVQNHHELIPVGPGYSGSLMMVCKFCAQADESSFWEELIGKPDDAPTHIP